MTLGVKFVYGKSTVTREIKALGMQEQSQESKDATMLYIRKIGDILEDLGNDSSMFIILVLTVCVVPGCSQFNCPPNDSPGF